MTKLEQPTALKKKLIFRSSNRRREGQIATSRRAAAIAAPNDLLPPMKLERRAISLLKQAKRRVRKTDPAQLERVMRSISSRRQVAPILIDGRGHIINGHIVVEALRELGETEAWCVILEHTSKEEAELIGITLNRIAECGEWSLEELRPVLIELEDIGFDLRTTGFSVQELDVIMLPDPSPQSDVEAEGPAEPPIVPVTEAGDLWCLGKHRLFCGDSTNWDSYAKVLAGRKVDAVFTDCPWNIPIEGFVSGLGKKKHQDFKMAAGEMPDEKFKSFVDTFSKHCANAMKPGAVYFSCIDWRSSALISTAAREAGFRHLNMAVWNKGSGGMGTLYRSAHELIHVFCRGDKPKTNNVELGRHGRDRTNVWSVPGANRPGSSANKALAHHPTPKPIELVEDALLDVTNRGELVLDPFLGSGTTLLAAERTKRLACGIELDPGYVDVCIRRWTELTGGEAILETCGRKFSEIALERSGEVAAVASGEGQ